MSQNPFLAFVFASPLMECQTLTVVLKLTQTLRLRVNEEIIMGNISKVFLWRVHTARHQLLRVTEILLIDTILFHIKCSCCTKTERQNHHQHGSMLGTL